MILDYPSLLKEAAQLAKKAIVFLLLWELFSLINSLFSYVYVPRSSPLYFILRIIDMVVFGFIEFVYLFTLPSLLHLVLTRHVPSRKQIMENLNINAKRLIIPGCLMYLLMTVAGLSWLVFTSYLLFWRGETLNPNSFFFYLTDSLAAIGKFLFVIVYTLSIVFLYVRTLFSLKNLSFWQAVKETIPFALKNIPLTLLLVMIFILSRVVTGAPYSWLYSPLPRVASLASSSLAHIVDFYLLCILVTYFRKKHIQ